MDEELEAAADEPMPLRTKIVAATIGVFVLLAAAAGIMRIGSPVISPAQLAPAGHYAVACGVCHTMSADAAIRGVE